MRPSVGNKTADHSDVVGASCKKGTILLIIPANKTRFGAPQTLIRDNFGHIDVSIKAEIGLAVDQLLL